MEFINSPGAGHEPVPSFAQNCGGWQFGCGCAGGCRASSRVDHISREEKWPLWKVLVALAAAYAIPVGVILWWLL